jgi:SAM-dependent methyltransferase
VASTVKQCIACGHRKFAEYSKDLVRCMNCGLIVARMIPTPKEIQELYQQDYFFGMEYSNYLVDRPALEHNFRNRIKRLSYMVQPNYHVVEIGCAYGYFLNLVQNKIKSHIGFDVTREGVAFAQKELGLNVTTEDFMEYPLKPNSIDSVFMWDVIEHLIHPEDYIRKVSQALKQGGHIALTTGDIDAWLAKRRGARWRMIHPPTHVYYFSPRTLDVLFRRYGLRTVSVRHRGVSRNVGSVCYQLVTNRKASQKGTLALQTAQRLLRFFKLDRLNVPLNTFDIMEVVAVKE